MKKTRRFLHRLHHKLYPHVLPFPYASGRRRLLYACIYVFGGAILSLFFLFLLVSATLPQVTDVGHLVAAQSSVILDRDGEVLYTLHGEENRQVVPLDQISRYAIDATLAIEDDRFYDHIGIDIPGILKAVCGEFGLCAPRGGSTITQQFVKNAFLSPERTYIRKLKEIILALRLEQAFTKDQILEMYLNRINYGSNIYGMELAAQTFFDKPAKDLDLLEAAIMAAVPKAPTFYSPYGNHQYAKIDLSEEEILNLDITSEEELIAYNPQFISKGLLGKTYAFGEARRIYVKGRVDFVLERMQVLGLIDESEARAALAQAETKELKPFRDAVIAPHFVLYVRELLEQKYGKDTLEKGGFKITTTLDAVLQKEADAAVGRYAEDNEKRLGVFNASLAALDPDNGHIVAMVGSRDYWNDEIDGKVNVVFRPRLPGSSFKPIVYAAAFLQGYSPATVLYDVKTKFGDTYEPNNFDGTFLGPVPIRKALAFSRNIPAVKIAYLAGLDNVIDLARKMGVRLNQPDDWYGLSLAIGAGEVRLMEMVQAYSVFANGGYQIEPVAILKVEDRQGNILEEYEPPDTRNLILDPQVAYLVTHILSDVMARPEGFWRDVLTIPGQSVAAKTGTSNKKKSNTTPSEDDDNVPFDCWTLGYARSLVAGVWAGNTDGSPLKLQADGLNAAGRIWRDFMTVALVGQPPQPFERPAGIRFIEVTKSSGKLPSEFIPKENIATEVFASFSVPQEVDDSYQIVEIDKVSGKLATEFTPLPAREKKAFLRHHSEFPNNPQWEDPVRAWAKENNQEEEPPTLYDDIHTAESEGVKPNIRIVSPTPDATVALPSLGVVVDLDSPAGIAQVDYYWDDTLLASVTAPPYRGQLTLSLADNPIGSSHVLKAVAFDSLYHSNQASIEVRVGEDVLPPQVQFVYPSSGAAIPMGSMITTQADAYDSNGDIQKVEWYWDDERKDLDREAPYLWSFIVSNGAGEHTLKAIAYDYAGNQAETEIKLLITAQDFSEFTGATRLLQPTPHQSFDQGESPVIKAYLDDSAHADFKNLLILAKPEKGNAFSIAETTVKTNAPFYTFIWPVPNAGRYELFLKIILQNGEIRFSERIPTVVR